MRTGDTPICVSDTYLMRQGFGLTITQGFGPRQACAVHMSRWGNKLLAKACSQKTFSSLHHCSKSIFNNVIFTLTIYSFCRLSDYFWSITITFWMMVARKNGYVVAQEKERNSVFCFPCLLFQAIVCTGQGDLWSSEAYSNIYIILYTHYTILYMYIKKTLIVGVVIHQ